MLDFGIIITLFYIGRNIYYGMICYTRKCKCSSKLICDNNVALL
jgi:hypothetical protein